MLGRLSRKMFGKFLGRIYEVIFETNFVGVWQEIFKKFPDKSSGVIGGTSEGHLETIFGGAFFGFFWETLRRILAVISNGILGETFQEMSRGILG